MRSVALVIVGIGMLVLSAVVVLAGSAGIGACMAGLAAVSIGAGLVSANRLVEPVTADIAVP